MTLYEMTEQAMALYELLQNDEIDEQAVADTLEAIGANEKIETYCKLIRQFEADKEAVKSEIDRMKAKKEAAENAVERLKNGILEFMAATDTTKADIGLFKLSVTESKAVDIIDESKIPQKFKIPQPDKIDKAGIREILKNGGSVEGTQLKINKGVRIK
ncbi:MAG: siphovirus Gp157 family protein [Clostridia bacterium]|nr:siphovirus Gp157 family protein [Clostridia bacterium]